MISRGFHNIFPPCMILFYTPGPNETLKSKKLRDTSRVAQTSVEIIFPQISRSSKNIFVKFRKPLRTYSELYFF